MFKTKKTKKILKVFLCLVFLSYIILFFGNEKTFAKNIILNNFYVGAGDGYTVAWNYKWELAHKAPKGGETNSAVDYIIVSTGINSVNQSEVWRSFFPIDTTNIPKEAVIVSAKLKVYPYWVENHYKDNNDWISLVQTSQASIYSVSPYDYVECGEVVNPIEGSNRININSISTSTYLEFVLNEEGLKWINKGGWTKLGLREGHDILNIPIIGKPYTFNRVGIRSSEYTNTEYRPFLEIVYINEDEDNFTFAHLTDVHLGANWVPGHRWSEELAYPRFTDSLYELGKMANKPDFVLLGGDIVEYAKTIWLKDYRSIINGFYKQSGIPVYTVPGNHDRYRSATGNALCSFYNNSFCEDDLSGYKQILDLPGPDLDETNYLVPGDPLNWRFEHKGVQFIGLDTGGDFLPDYELGDAKDGGPEGSGLSAAQFEALVGLDKTIPKAILTHHPVKNGGEDACTRCPGDRLEDGSFAFYHEDFLNFAAENNVELVLSGHTHDSRVYDRGNNDLEESSLLRPLFIQTPSAVKDGKAGRGYRLINFENGKADIETPQATGQYEKTVAKISGESGLEMKIHDPLNRSLYITPTDESGFSLPFFSAAGTGRVILYEAGPESIISVENNEEARQTYNLSLRQEEISGVPKTKEKRLGFAIGCSTPVLGSPFASFHFDDENRAAILDFKSAELAAGDIDSYELDWEEILASQGASGVIYKNNDSTNNFKRLPASLTASLASPAELRLVDLTGRRTGQVNGEPVEEIPYSLYEWEYESATAYFKESENEQPLWVEVVGLPDVFDLADDNYSLTVTLDRADGESTEFRAVNIPIASGTAFRFGFDWEKLARGEAGAEVAVDREGDGTFELIFITGAEFRAADYYEQLPRRIKERAQEKLMELNGRPELAKYDLSRALRHLEQSLNPLLWLDEARLNPAGGDAVFLYERQTASELKALIARISKDRNIDVVLTGALNDIADDLARADRILAEVIYRETVARLSAGMTAKQAALMALAMKKIDQGNAAVNPLVAINFYSQAWAACRDAE